MIDINQRQFDPAEAAYRVALDLQPDFTQAAVNLADRYRIQGRDADGEKTLLRYGYVYAVALNSAGQSKEAVQTLESILAKHPNDRDTLLALVAFQRDAGNLDVARSYARRWATLKPDNPEVSALLKKMGVTP